MVFKHTDAEVCSLQPPAAIPVNPGPGREWTGPQQILSRRLLCCANDALSLSEVTKGSSHPRRAKNSIRLCMVI